MCVCIIHVFVTCVVQAGHLTTYVSELLPFLSLVGASVVLILLHAVAMGTPTPQQTVDEELGIVMEDVTAS